DGLSDGQIEALFRAQRDAEYGELGRAAAEVAGGSGNGGERDSSGELARLERRLGEIAALDHFGAPGRRAAEAALTRARDRSKPARRSRTSAARPARPARPAPPLHRRAPGERGRLGARRGEIAPLDHSGAPGRRAAEAALTRARDRSKPARRSRTSAARPARPARPAPPVHGRTWVTRSGVHVDRIASAWLIRRFIDPKARFRFVASHDARTAPGGLRFDMFEAEYTHEGDRC